MGIILSAAQVKAYVPVEHAGDDTLIDDLINQAEGMLQGYLGVPITAAEVTEYHDGGTSTLFLKRFPLDEDSVVVEDTQGTNEDATDDETLDAELYRVYPEEGMVLKTTTNGEKSTWAQGRRRWKITYTGGLDQHPDWSDRVIHEMRASLRDLVAEWYQHRHPGRAQVSEGAGMGNAAMMGLDASIPPRVREVWDRYASPLG